MSTSVTVRMYLTGGLGDCFLLFFTDPARTAPRTMLIDCGVFLGTPGGKARMRQIAADIARSTNNHLDVLVATHEHWDHISGFRYASDIFDAMTIDQVWLGWTEKPPDPTDPADPVVRAIQSGRAELQTKLRDTVKEQAEHLGGRADPRLASVSELLSFNSIFGAGGGQGGTAGIMQSIASLSKQVGYLRPDEKPRALADLDGVRVFALGPPLEEKYLRMSTPTAGQVYGVVADGGLTAFRAASPLGLTEDQLAWLLPGSAPADTWIAPFDYPGALPLEQAAGDPLYAAYLAGPDWRRIDAPLTGTLEQLALKLDEDTNNTSLALAIELEDGGPVLLFPGDAQVGSWESWKGLEIEVSAGEKVKAADLLARTVFYKVGHHGSLNATLRSGGLDQMKSPNLVAAIPVYEAQAQNRKWEMPARGLYAALQEKTAGRILRMDRPGQTFMDKVKWAEGEPLWVEYRVGEN